ncbi:MAG TPA: SLC13 family permease [Anaerolineales bacterium]|nr:SLC13 family permease [Anaerolineales bacterium]
MTFQIISLLIILGIALVFFTFEWLSVDIVALGVLLALVLFRLVPLDRAFVTFGSDTVILILGLLILTATLVRTGVVEIAGRLFMRRLNNNPKQILWIVMGAAAGMSAFMSNTAAAAFFVPIVMGLANRLRINASRLLMPLAFAAILASSVTLVGTSTNIVVSGVMTQYGLSPMRMFELTPVGLPIVLVGLAYMAFVGIRLVPQRSVKQDLTSEFDMPPYTTEITIMSASPLVGKTLSESGLGRDMDITVLRIVRDDGKVLAPLADERLTAGDVLLVEASRDEIVKIKDSVGIGIEDQTTLNDPDLQAEDVDLAEVILLPRSPFIGRRPRGLELRERFGLQVLAINRHEQTIHRKVSQVPLRMGDVLLVQGPRQNISVLERNNAFRVIGRLDTTTPDFARARLSVAIFVGALLLATLELVSLPVAVLIGVVLVFLTNCITPEEAYRAVEWKAIILIGSMLAFGTAMEYTGTAQFLARQIVLIVGDANPIWLLSSFFGLTVLLTQPMSNQAAAVVVLPVAIQAALQLGLNPRTFAMMIAIAASTSYITPLEPACLIVYGLGHYKFMDFIKVGSLLTVLIYLLAILLVPIIWPLA